MNWTLVIVNGLMMAAFFNLSAMLMVAVNPRYMMGSYPKAIQEAAPQKQTEQERTVLRKCLFVLYLLPLVFGAIGFWQADTVDFGALVLAAYVQWMLVNFMDFILLDVIALHTMLDRMVVPGTEGNAWYQSKNWIGKYAVPEHFLMWPLMICPVAALLQTGLVMLLRML